MYYRTPANKITPSWKKWYLSAHINIKHCKKKHVVKWASIWQVKSTLSLLLKYSGSFACICIVLLTSQNQNRASKLNATTRSLNMQSVHVVTVIIFIMFEVFINAYTSYSVIFLWNYLCWSLPFSFLSRNILFIYFLGGGGPAGFLWSHIRQSGSPCMKKNKKV